MKHTLWQHPFWNALAHDRLLYVTEVPHDVSIPLWQGKDIFFIHPSEHWDLYTLTEWSDLYEMHGLVGVSTRRLLLNDLLKTFPLYHDHPLSRRFAKALWLAVWCGIPLLWVHPQWKETHPRLQQACSALMENNTLLPVQWIVCNHQTQPSLPWHQLTYETHTHH